MPHWSRRLSSMAGFSGVALSLCVSSCVYPRGMSRVESAPACGASPSDTVSLEWYRPTEERDARLVQEWCETVAPPVLALRPVDAFSGWGERDTLRVVSWNMNVGGGDLLAFLRDELHVDCSRSGPITLPKYAPFVLLLQESYRKAAGLEPVRRGPSIPWRIDPKPRPGIEADVVQAASACGLALIYIPSARNGADAEGRVPEDKGNAIVSSLPLSGPFAVDLPFEAGRKVAVGAMVRVPNGEVLQVVSVHLDVASTLFRTLITGNGTRLRQVSGVTDVLNARPAVTTLVGGDFNTWSTYESALVHMVASFPDLPIDDSETRGSMPADHMFLRTPVGSGVSPVDGSYTVVEDSYLSDHHARSILFTVAGEP